MSEECPKILDYVPRVAGDPHKKFVRKKETEVDKFRKRNIAECWDCRWLTGRDAGQCRICMERKAK